ncbi:MAG: Fpg/Nei family DNA glycosylase [Verrucomicrobia bacterium]|nr:MAG: Fpg/Nei family DNA glycosylase [Verrucomicrobiota bacterium]
MPELAEVELARRIWEPAQGQEVIAVESHPETRVYRDTPAGEIQTHLTRKMMVDSRTHGKRLLFGFSDSLTKPSAGDPVIYLEVHLGMSGRLFLADPYHCPDKHDHFVLRTKNLSLVYSDYRQFGRVYLHQQDHKPWETLPLEVLHAKFTLAYLRQLTTRRKGTSLKALLLDQSIFPGIGNWMADEICWRLFRFPGTPLQELDLAVIRRVSRQVCRGALRHVADKNSPRDGKRGFSPGSYVEQVPPSSWLFQHRWKAGGTCPRCHSPLERCTIATRTTAWCPRCQPMTRSDA